MSTDLARQPQLRRSLSFIEGYKEVMKEMGFIVICWDPEGPHFYRGDPVWGEWEPPEPVFIRGRSGVKQFSRQMEILLKHGYPAASVPKPPPGWRFSKVGRKR
jgi:hypothetical protein